MATKVFINLPVKDLEQSKSFFQNLGFSVNPQFTDEKASCLVISESIYVMLLTNAYFQTFIKTEICDARKATEVLVALDAASKEEVQEIISKAQAAGAQLYAEPQDYGWMYQHSFADLDGHKWEFVYMDSSHMPTQE
ncbi:putative lactoylglutathione lyase [Chitinophaga terrae (ex Kim and Jung 2007)]|jgi:predicted lactoylglutathione lyase|uniref:VOC family protein n=1 Tax=Chitinophaga terrae (ex Kim and Jung 2007) TaxID=408074 RepID=UPI0027818167|nr:VOC family protein [Chitinophaga terrae (ex Kim and Jung 2007)]MDQ0109581.1 putative lactoylglutathione lyase [Chitinophaga terrae (ex Kim and Jung 2007)]